MNNQPSDLSIGQEFAVWWMNSRYQKDEHGEPSVVFSRIADAVDGYADKKRAELDTRLREMVREAAQGNDEDCREVVISSGELLTFESLTWVARDQFKRRGLSPIYKFPV